MSHDDPAAQLLPAFENPRSNLKLKSDRELGFALLSYFLVVTLLITLAPFRFEWPRRLHFLWRGGWFDTATNVLLFLPLGFLYRLARKGAHDPLATQVLWRAFLLSMGIELSQIFLPGRFTSPLDVLTNATGAWAGAWLHDQVQGKLGRHWVGRLALELPLMNIVYLLTPLIWLNGMASGNDYSRRWLTLLPGVCGGVILAAVYLNRLKPVATLRATTLALAAGTWFVLSIVPGFISHPLEVMAAGIGVGLFVRLLTSIPVLHWAGQRRFELPTLRRVFVIYAVYLGLLTLWPLPATFAAWRGGIGFSTWPNTPGVVAVLRLVEWFAAFTLLGYLVAESHGRSPASVGRSLNQTLLWCGAVAAASELLRGFHPQQAASLLQGSIALSASLYGAVIYWLQLSSIQRILAAPATSGSSEGSPAPAG